MYSVKDGYETLEYYNISISISRMMLEHHNLYSLDLNRATYNLLIPHLRYTIKERHSLLEQTSAWNETGVTWIVISMTTSLPPKVVILANNLKDVTTMERQSSFVTWN